MRRILIVDDEETNQRLFKAILRATGYETLRAYDGAECIKIAIEYLPDLIIMDIQIPQVDRITASKILQSEPSTMNIPIKALTSYAMKGDREKFLSIGFKDYIAKPISVPEFTELISSHCS